MVATSSFILPEKKLHSYNPTDTGYVAMAKNNPQGKEGNAQIERLYSSTFEVITQF